MIEITPEGDIIDSMVAEAGFNLVDVEGWQKRGNKLFLLHFDALKPSSSGTLWNVFGKAIKFGNARRTRRHRAFRTPYGLRNIEEHNYAAVSDGQWPASKQK